MDYDESLMGEQADAEILPSRPKKSVTQYVRRVGIYLMLFIVGYFLLAYVAAPMIWRGYERLHPALKGAEAITQTGDHHPGDPINIALMGSEDDLRHAMEAAGWRKADPLGLRSDASIAIDTVVGRSYATAPVSNLYYWGRKEDIAFEQPAAKSPSQRHHVRFWKSTQIDQQGRPLWMGAATFDKSVGLSHTTGQITHHIDGDVDAERDHLLETLVKAGCAANENWGQDFHKIRKGKNGGGDQWHTDGRLVIVTLGADRPTSATTEQ